MYEKIKLTYKYHDLEPYIDKLTVKTHYEKHLQSYVNNLNTILKDYEEFTKGKTIEDILGDIDNIPKEITQGVINQGGGVSNHNFYFSILHPKSKGKQKPEGKLMEVIIRDFGSFEKMKTQLSNASISQFGSGWGWLVLDENGKLQIIKTMNQDSPLSLNKKPLLAIDVWEHAYYLKYKNLRNEYVKNLWKIINWSKIEEIYESYNK
ncbi:superoxide dismutase [Haloimpatiens sp. FM7315]|uniref:superoxide dismutase n=1 Tax=Haloimpatiens sp. FM7315 TaxID=3298609 RepID=UPI00370A6D94